MQNCQEFKQWLFDQKGGDENTYRQVMGHLQDCDTCNQLYRSDMVLEEMLRKSMRPVDPPPGLIVRAREKIESRTRPKPLRFIGSFWKTATVTLSLAVLALIIMAQPFSGQLQALDQMAAYGIANHVSTTLQETFQANDAVDPIQWLTRWVGDDVRLPDLDLLGLTLLGGRKCSLGKVEAALLFCDKKGKRASLFVIRPSDVVIDFEKIQKYVMASGEHKVTVWQEGGMVYCLVV